MAGSYCKLFVIGYVARDPEMRYLPSGDPVTDFSLPVSERRRDGTETTTWFRINAFGKLAETCKEYLHKGSYVYVEGALSQREWTDRDGNTRASLDVRAREMRMLDRRGDAGDSGAEPGLSIAPPQADDETNMDDIPF